jgi:C4-dicarboxylate-specific signal transduction histidine kinase
VDDLVTEALAGVSAANALNDDRLQELHRLTELGRLSAHLLHEISNPLTAAILHLEQHGKQSSASVQHARRSMRILQRYVEAARQQVRGGSQSVNFYLRPQLSDLRRVLQPLARQAGVRLRVETAANYRLFGDPVKFQQIVANAIDAYGGLPADSYEKNVEAIFTSKNQWLIIEVKDRGTGISSENLPRIFEPFFTTKDTARDGLGVGLAMVKQSIEADFSGSIAATSTQVDGTCFRARLRLVPAYSRK